MADPTTLASLDFVTARIPRYEASATADAALEGYIAQATTWFLGQTGRTLQDFAEGVPADVQGAVAAWAVLLQEQDQHPGVMRRDVAGASVDYQTLTVPVHIQSVVDAYRSYRSYFGRSA